MRRSAICITIIFLCSICFLNAQQAKQNKSNLENEKNNISNKSEKTQAINDKVSFKDGTTTLLEINSEGSAGSLIFPNVGSSLSGNKLYNNGSHLFWGLSQLDGSNGSSFLNDLSDAKYIGHSLFLGEGSGDHDDGSDNANTAVGYISLQKNTFGYVNTAVGGYALHSNTSGFGNTAAGYEALASNLTGDKNTAVGFLTLTHNTSGDSNSVLGAGALYSNTTGYENTAIGDAALYSNITGYLNTAIGSNAFYNVTDGSYNTAVGFASGYTVDHPFNTTALGARAFPTASNTVQIGSIEVESIGGYAPWSDLSDGRFKRNVKENVSGLNFILGLRPVTFNFDMNAISNNLQENFTYEKSGIKKHIDESPKMIQSREEKSKKRRVGFIAQEVESLVNKLGIDFDGVEKPENENDFYRLRYSEFVVPLVKAVQEQQTLIQKLTKRIEDLENRNDN